jgi:adenosine deaminase
VLNILRWRLGAVEEVCGNLRANGGHGRRDSRVTMSSPPPLPTETPSSLALRSLTASQVSFLQSLPKAELHAHLNGSIPLSALQHLASTCTPFPEADHSIQAAVTNLSNGVRLDQINDFFSLFPAIYALTSTPSSLGYATRSVLSSSLSSSCSPAQCTYVELRTTPRTTPSLTYRQYLQVVLDEIEVYPPDQAALIVSIDRRMSNHIAGLCVDLAADLKKEGRRVVGVDLCGDPTVSFFFG